MQNSFCLKLWSLSTSDDVIDEVEMSHSCCCHARKPERKHLLTHWLARGTSSPELKVEVTYWKSFGYCVTI